MIKYLGLAVILVSLLYGQVNAEGAVVIPLESAEIPTHDLVLTYLELTGWNYCISKITQAGLDSHRDRTLDEVRSYTCGYQTGSFLNDHSFMDHYFDRVFAWFLDKWISIYHLENFSIPEYRVGYFDAVKGQAGKYESNLPQKKIYLNLEFEK